MAKLIFSLDGAFLGEYPLDKERISIGRRSANDIHIDNLAVSGQHAEVVTIGNDSFLEDLDSTNGTRVNGKPIKKHILQHGDVIELGRHQLKYVNEAVMNAATGSGNQADFEKSMMMRPAAMKPVATAEPEKVPNIGTEIPPSAVHSPSATLGESAMDVPLPAHIRVLSGPNAGKELVLNKALTTMGKQGVQVAVIARRPHGYFITHVEGKNHPVVNGQSVGAQAHPLNDHDVIEIAGVNMEFYLGNL